MDKPTQQQRKQKLFKRTSISFHREKYLIKCGDLILRSCVYMHLWKCEYDKEYDKNDMKKENINNPDILGDPSHMKGGGVKKDKQSSR